MEKQEIFEKIKAALIEDFDIDEANLVPEAKLYEDLELDSIDAVDLIVKLKSFCRETLIRMCLRPFARCRMWWTLSTT